MNVWIKNKREEHIKVFMPFLRATMKDQLSKQGLDEVCDNLLFEINSYPLVQKDIKDIKSYLNNRIVDIIRTKNWQ